MAKFSTLPNTINTLSGTFNNPITVFKHSATSSQVNSAASLPHIHPTGSGTGTGVGTLPYKQLSKHPLEPHAHIPIYCINTVAIDKTNGGTNGANNTNSVNMTRNTVNTPFWIQFSVDSNVTCGSDLLCVDTVTVSNNTNSHNSNNSHDRYDYDYSDLMLIANSSSSGSSRSKPSIVADMDVDMHHCVELLVDQVAEINGVKGTNSTKGVKLNSSGKLPKLKPYSLSSSSSSSNSSGTTSSASLLNTHAHSHSSGIFPLSPTASTQYLPGVSHNHAHSTHSVLSVPGKYSKSIMYKYICQSVEFWKVIDRVLIHFPSHMKNHVGAGVGTGADIGGRIFVPVADLVDIYQGYNTDK